MRLVVNVSKGKSEGKGHSEHNLGCGLIRVLRQDSGQCIRMMMVYIWALAQSASKLLASYVKYCTAGRYEGW